MRFIKNPNLPQNEVTLAAISALAGESIKKLNDIGIKTLKIQPINNLPAGISSHSDLQLLHFNDNLIYLTASCKDEHLYDYLSDEPFSLKVVSQELKAEYPGDVLLNAKIIGRYIICNKRTISCEVLNQAEKDSLVIIDVKQGYSGCSVCVLNENAVITDDIGIYKAAQKFLNDVTFIEKESIKLEGYNYGFIGGCCGKIANNIIAFNGEIESHKSHNVIYDALNRNNINAIELTKGPLTDIGGIIPLKEKNI